MRRILALTSIRSEYDLMSRVYELLHRDSEVDLRLLVSGAHLSPSHGMTVRHIRADGFHVLAEVETLISADSPSSRLKTASGLLSGSVDLVRQFAPDVIVYAGDREDVLIGAMIGGFLGIPTAHFFAGDHAADGHIDNPVRHATSKLSSAHFVSIPEHKQRLLALGEAEQRVFVIGSVALDKFRLEPALDVTRILDKIGAKQHALESPLAILIFHPIGAEADCAASYLTNAAQALIEAGYHVCLGAPNTDPGNFALLTALEQLARQEQVTLYKNLSRAEFVNLFRAAKIIVGNSSAGLLEAASLKIPAINVGARQRGRLCGANVLFTDGDKASVATAIQTARSSQFQSMLAGLANPYGDGYSSEAAAHLLKTVDFSSLLHKTEDPLHVIQRP
ncbi:UDP-N-acetylglucosamine 2-epimerase [Massilia agilis]|uniref:UDP-N-acetylglucosamine 2-epimerase n=1 Tax=Massilia agilis TaxID=1811226 RepID=A0ABT2D867_9BURK|nr:UDP-N-acetylglucosamine 2-epimerase [Massilia agilis]MCS0807449.1 UDP-N-acetylglucosamine 2-epimerase [Massilia agilis]